MFGNKPFDTKIHQKYLNHEDINNLKGLEVELIYEWELGSMLIFDRSHLHCSSSVIKGKKNWDSYLYQKVNFLCFQKKLK